MANPNIIDVTTIKGITKTQASTAGLVDFTAYPPIGTVFKVNSLIACNIHASAAKDVSIALLTGSTIHYIASTVSVPADSSLVIIDKNSSFYLNDNTGGLGQKLQVIATDVNINIILSYEEIS